MPSVPEAVQRVSTLSPVLLRVLDEVLLATMDLLLTLFAQVKAENANAAAREARLQSVRKRAAALVSFSNAMKNKLYGADTTSRLARMEATLV